MSFLAPIWLAAAAAVGIGLVIAHLFSTSVPPRDYLPTVRFVPEGAPLAVMRTRKVSDIALLLLRVLAVALFGLALAGAHVPKKGPARVVLVDASRATRSFAEVRDSARAIAAGETVLIAFDSAARRVSADSLAAMDVTQTRGSVSAAIVVAHRALSGVTSGRERAELVIVSPLVREEVDSATASLLELWSGPVRHVRVAAASDPGVEGVLVRAAGDDPIAAAIGTADPLRATREAKDLLSGVRIIRTSLTRSDSLWARDSGGVLVVWPADLRSSALERRTSVDTQNAIAAGAHVVVASFARTHQPRPGRSVVRWNDGESAATETSLGRGCVREVAIPVDAVGDVALRASFSGVLAALAEPCGGARDFRASVIPSRVPAERAMRDLHLATRQQVQIPRGARDDTTGVAIWLAALAIAALIGEQFLRARVRATA